jgi:hypothetical protein
MNTHADKSQEHKSQSVSNTESQMQRGGEATFQFVDNRPEAVAQRKLQEMANNSARVIQLKAFQYMANNSQQSKQVAQLATIEEAQTFSDMMQPNETLGVSKDEVLEETQILDVEDLESQVNQLMKNAAIAKDDFIVMMNRVIEKSGDKAKNGDPGFGHANKATQGAIDKAKGRMTGKTTAALNDVLRGTIVCDDMETLNIVQKNLDKESLDLFEQIGGKTQKKNAFEKSERKTAGDMVGYGDIKYIMPVVHYKSEGQVDFWMYCEIQVMSSAMKEKKAEGGHSFYDITRESKVDKSTESDIYKITSTESSKSGADQLLNKYPELLQKGVNTDTLTSLIPKLHALISGQDIELSDRENNELGFAGELIYRKERLEGNLIAHGIL